jgi:hypothetical protein
MTASCGFSRDRGKISYEVERSFGATGLPEFYSSTQKEEKMGEKKDSLHKADNATLARGGELPTVSPTGIYPGVRSLIIFNKAKKMCSRFLIILEGRLKSHPSFTSLLQNNLFRETVFSLLQ